VGNNVTLDLKNRAIVIDGFDFKVSAVATTNFNRSHVHLLCDGKRITNSDEVGLDLIKDTYEPRIILETYCGGVIQLEVYYPKLMERPAISTETFRLKGIPMTSFSHPVVYQKNVL